MMLSRRKQAHTTKWPDFESNKAVLKDLYLTQDKSLKEVMQIMTMRHNFEAK